jgi:hypothetical protein
MALSRTSSVANYLILSLLPLASWAYPSHDTSWPIPLPEATNTSSEDPTSTSNTAASVTTHRRLPYPLYTHLAIANSHNGSPTNSNTLSNGAKAGIGIGISLMLLVFVTIFFIFRHKKREKQRLRNRYRSMETWAAQQNEMAFNNHNRDEGMGYWEQEHDDILRGIDRRNKESVGAASLNTTPASSIGKVEPLAEVPKAHVTDSGAVKDR